MRLGIGKWVHFPYHPPHIEHACATRALASYWTGSLRAAVLFRVHLDLCIFECGGEWSWNFGGSRVYYKVGNVLGGAQMRLFGLAWA